MSTIRSTVNNPGTKGSVQVLNNLQTTLMKKKREDECIHDNKTFYENIFSFLTSICTWSSRYVSLSIALAQQGCTIVPVQQHGAAAKEVIIPARDAKVSAETVIPVNITTGTSSENLAKGDTMKRKREFKLDDSYSNKFI
jgi:hypothetical protein